MKFILSVLCIIALSAFTLPKIDSIGKVEKQGVDIIYHNVQLSGQTIDKIIIHNLRKTPLTSYIDNIDFYLSDISLKLTDIILSQSKNNINALACSKLLLEQNNKILARATQIKLSDSADKSQQLLNFGSFDVQAPTLYKGSAHAILALNNKTHNLVIKDLNITSTNEETTTGLIKLGNVKGLSTLELFTSNFAYANLVYKSKAKKQNIIAKPATAVSFFAIYLLKDHMPELLKLLNVSVE